MNWLLSNTAIFTGLVLLVFAYLFTLTAFKVGGFKEMLAYYQRNPEYKDWLGLLWVPTLIMFVAALLSGQAQAQSFTYLDFTRVHAGMEIPLEGGATQFCKPSASSVENRQASNLGVTQHLIGWYDVDVVAAYTHHSCAIDSDQDVYDGVGFHITWTHHW